MKAEVIVVAAGLGQRLHSKVPKALVLLKGKPLVSYCLKVFNAHKDIDGIVVVGVKKYLRIFDRLAFSFKKVRAVVAGGPRRSDSVKCGLRALSPDTDIVLVHDAARPFIENAVINRLLGALKKNKAATVGVPLKFTVKKIDRKTLNTQETPPRDLLWEAQTPQGFHKNVLLKAHDVGAINKKAQPLSLRMGSDLRTVTDDAMMVERIGTKVKMVRGSYRNIKITTPEDIILARQLLVKEGI